jgi:hypothetical protein
MTIKFSFMGKFVRMDTPSITFNHGLELKVMTAALMD